MLVNVSKLPVGLIGMVGRWDDTMNSDSAVQFHAVHTSSFLLSSARLVDIYTPLKLCLLAMHFYLY